MSNCDLPKRMSEIVKSTVVDILKSNDIKQYDISGDDITIHEIRVYTINSGCYITFYDDCLEIWNNKDIIGKGDFVICYSDPDLFDSILKCVNDIIN